MEAGGASRRHARKTSLRGRLRSAPANGLDLLGGPSYEPPARPNRISKTRPKDIFPVGGGVGLPDANIMTED